MSQRQRDGGVERTERVSVLRCWERNFPRTMDNQLFLCKFSVITQCKTNDINLAETITRKTFRFVLLLLRTFHLRASFSLIKISTQTWCLHDPVKLSNVKLANGDSWCSYPRSRQACGEAVIIIEVSGRFNPLSAFRGTIRLWPRGFTL